MHIAQDPCRISQYFWTLQIWLRYHDQWYFLQIVKSPKKTNIVRLNTPSRALRKFLLKRCACINIDIAQQVQQEKIGLREVGTLLTAFWIQSKCCPINQITAHNRTWRRRDDIPSYNIIMWIGCVGWYILYKLEQEIPRDLANFTFPVILTSCRSSFLPCCLSINVRYVHNTVYTEEHVIK